MHKSEKAMKWGLRIHLLWYVIANVAQVILWGILTPDVFFWPLWSILGWGIGLVIHFWVIRTTSRSFVRP
ncbi:2TM domain-containing protein [Streptomyces sp. S.PB5]|uniref:2TM domain-containing protein n=1 Tax=Streptomyces sp. S.PB5 TaxID=3020844 RepID=UPI0025AFD648|nr:2TM domain-containing protein [Streptomyces sp. S.PB5]MDN3021381.1 2TM domain-containing protein [Streptomyces sp. S.PB5]